MQGVCSVAEFDGNNAHTNGSIHSSNSNGNCLSIIYFNARSLLPKLDELSAIAEIQRSDVICIVETWLCPDINDSEIAIQGYQTDRLDRDRHGAGVILYILENYIVKVGRASPGIHDSNGRLC